jgi:addiction module HigA family antidote
MPRPVVRPGKVLAEELQSLGVTPTELARQIEVPPNRISQIINGKRAITGDTAVRLAHWFGTHPEFWLNLQSTYELRQAERHLGASVRRLPTKAHRLAQSPSSRPKAAT